MSNANTKPLQEQWSSKWAFVIAATGAAVGLGNIWRFPYLAANHGGGAFLCLYIICLLILGLPMLMAEILIGRQARTNSVDAMKTLAEQHNSSSHWQLISWWGALALIIILSFYSVVSGWSIAYLFHSLFVGYQHQTASAIQQDWSTLMAHPWHLLLWHSIFMSLTIGVIILGVEKGLERATKLMMPALYLILFILVAIAARVGRWDHAVHYLFHVRWADVNTSSVVAALGQAFFSLALGAGAMLTYGAYAPKQASLPFTVSVVACLDVVVAVLAGLAIFPLVFGFHLSLNAGPKLMFITLPVAFSHMAYGSLVGSAFFILLLFAAWTSSINLTEPMVLILMNKKSWSRRKAAISVGLTAWLLGIVSLLSLNVWQHIRIFNHTFFSLATDIPTNFILPLGGLGYAIFVGWVLPKKISKAQVNSTIYSLWLFTIRYITPVAILVLLIKNWIPS